MKDRSNSPLEVESQLPVDKLPSNGFTQRIKEQLVDIVAQLAAGGALIIVVIYLSFASPVFLSLNNLFNIVSQTAVTAVIALGMTFVIITAGIDLSVGSNAALSGVVGVMMIVYVGVPWPLAILGGTLIGGLIGLVNGLLINTARLSPFITTLGMMGVARGLVSIVTNSVGVYGTPNDFQLLGEGSIDGIPIPLIVVVILALVAYFILSRTRLGRYTYAIGSNSEAARLSGIPIKRYLVGIYLLQGVLAGFAGMIASSRVNSGQPNFGDGLELDVIAAVVIGGASLMGGQGTILGTLIGAFLISIIRNGAVLLNINIYYQNVIIGLVIWLAVFWDQFRRRKFTNV